MALPTRKCAYCGKEFTPRRYNSKYCDGPHYMQCPACGTMYLVTDHSKLSKPAAACSYKCRSTLASRTSMERYGCKSPGNSPAARDKARKTSAHHFGVDHPMQNRDVKAKQVTTLIHNHHVSNPGQIKSLFQDTSEREILSQSDCKLLVLHKQYADRFLNKYDRHKTSRYHELCLGFVWDDKIVEVMTFGRSRTSGYDYQLFRACRSEYEVKDGIFKAWGVATIQFELTSVCCKLTDLSLSLKEVQSLGVAIVM